MSTPVVVQGTPVMVEPSAPPSAFETTATTSGNTSNTNRNDKVETRCNDPFFAFLFYCTAIAIIVVAAIYGPDAMSLSTSHSDTDYSGYLSVSIILVIVSLVGAGLGVWVMMCIPEFLIKAALIFSVVMTGVWMALAFAYGEYIVGIVGVIFFAVSICYAYCVWSRIPFATANLVTAISAIKANLGITGYVYLFAVLGAAWYCVWALAMVGVFDTMYNCDENGVCTDPRYGIIFLLFLCLFFVSEVIQGSIHTIVAGTVGTWWYSPSETGCCSPAINNSVVRTLTTSFGSICFGSLLVALIRALKALAQSARENGDAALCACIAECILGCLAAIVDYFNKWAFIYVGLYGMPYLKAGKAVIELFRNRGWEAIIADDLIDNTLFLVAIIVGGVVGCIGIVIDVTSNLMQDAGDNSKVWAFVLGLVIGGAISMILFSSISSAVNAVIVLFAEGPAEFQQNHPELSNKMREVWSQIYPGSI